ncbi:MAG: glycosyltransferase [Actinomycetota bacterium]|nr:glycosyltransferase [Actinomycetota bacterium]
MSLEPIAAVARSGDLRLREPTWDPRGPGVAHRMRLIGMAHSVAALWYFGWLLQPARVGHPVLYALPMAAELFNLLQAAGFWWTVAHERVRDGKRSPGKPPVDVFIPVYDEPVQVVEPTVAAAARLRGAEVRVALLDDGVRDEVRAVAERHGVRYIAREESTGAKAGNINHALPLTSAPYVLVLDCDHVPSPRFLERTLGHFADPHLGFVQTPQYYANAARGGVAAAAWGQQALFFGAIARGKDGMGAMFCCGTNVLYRRAALDHVGGFPEESVTEDFELSIRLHERGWNSAYVPEVLANGLGPEDMAAYVGQQDRWARGCLAAFTVALRAKLPWRLKLQYVLSSMFFFTGWTFLLYMLFPVIRIMTGAQPIGGASADLFILHFAPYFGIALGGRRGRCRRVHLRRVLADGRQLLGPRACVAGQPPEAPVGVHRDTQGGGGRPTSSSRVACTGADRCPHRRVGVRPHRGSQPRDVQQRRVRCPAPGRPDPWRSRGVATAAAGARDDRPR